MRRVSVACAGYIASNFQFESIDLERTTVLLGLYDQANKRAWWMPWRQKAMKDVVVCDKPRGADKQASIRGFPNGETRPVRVIMH